MVINGPIRPSFQLPTDVIQQVTSHSLLRPSDPIAFPTLFRFIFMPENKEEEVKHLSRQPDPQAA